jgi:hypothetical protein
VTAVTAGTKGRAEELLRRKRSRVLYLDHVESDGVLLFEQVVKIDLEGVVYKRKHSAYKATEKPPRDWIKVKNRATANWKGARNCSSGIDRFFIRSHLRFSDYLSRWGRLIDRENESRESRLCRDKD